MKRIYKVQGMHCPSCAMLIEGELKEVGIECRCNFICQELSFNDILKPEDEIGVKKIINKLGYKISNSGS